MPSIKSISPDLLPDRASRKSDPRMLVICQILGLIVLAVVIYAVWSDNYRILKYMAFLAPILLVIPKPNLVPYMFILSFFTMISVYAKGYVLRVYVTDIMFLLMFFAFLSDRKKIDIKAAFEKQRFLIISLIVFVLWAVFGFFMNCYNRMELENVTSLLYIFKFIEMAIMVILFSLPQWKEHRDNLIRFYVVCSFCEIVVAILMKVLAGARTFYGFHKFTGTLGVHHGMMGNFLVLSFGVAACAFFELRGKYERLFSLFVAFLSIGALMLSGTRSAILGVLLAVPVFIFLVVRVKWSISFVVLAIISVFAVTVFFTIDFSVILNTAIRALSKSVNTGSGDLSAYGRFLIWQRVYEYAMYAPWSQKIIGLGVGAFTTLKFDYFLEVGTFTTGAHNNFLHAFVEAGIVGVIIFLAIFIHIIRRIVLKGWNKNNTARCFLLSTLILLFSCLTQETFWFNSAFGMFWLHYMFFYLIIFNFQNEERFVPRKEDKNEIAYRKTGL